jgi:hypothetical protein
MKTIYLAIHFWDMLRAKVQFEKQVFTIVLARMGLSQKKQFTLLESNPSNEGFQRTR